MDDNTLEKLEVFHDTFYSITKDFMVADCCISDLIETLKNPVSTLMGTYTIEIVDKRIKQVVAHMDKAIEKTKMLERYMKGEQ